MDLPPLPPRSAYGQGGSDAFHAAHAGPTPLSNWVIKGRVLASAYPSPFPSSDGIRAIADAKIDLIVCLQQAAELRALPPYRAAFDAVSPGMGYAMLEIADGGVASDDDALSLARHLLSRIRGGTVVMLHCLGGHGRTGTYAALLLAGLYGISSVEAMDRVQALHDSRAEPRGAPSPETGPQREQVHRLAAVLAAERQADD